MSECNVRERKITRLLIHWFLYRIPSPQTTFQHTESLQACSEQKKLFSTKHVEEHPSPPILLPSSQASSDAFTPSPQGDEHVSGEVGLPPVQANPHSTVQVAEHPSLDTEPPSSHPSVLALLPSPQTVLHTD